MAKQPNIRKELKALGFDLASALKQIRSSHEFRALQKDVAKGLRTISGSISRSISTARKSQSAAQIRRRVKRVVSASEAEGKVQAVRARASLAKGLRKARIAFQQLTTELKKRAKK